MRRLLPLLLAAAIPIAACSRAGAPSGEHNAGAPAPPASADLVASESAAPSTAAPGRAGAAQRAPVPPGAAVTVSPAATPQLAYSYAYGVEAAAGRIRALMAQDQAGCAAAGPASCQVTGANLSAAGPDQVSAKLTFKATPAWLTGYGDRLAHDVEAAGGRLVQSNVTTEDLTRQIVDTDATVRAKTALRDRLQQMLQTRSGPLDDLLSVEEKLAEVQGELDATTSELAVMRERVATSDVTIEYNSTGVLAPKGVWSPIGQAVSGVTAALALTVAAMIYVVAYLLPWALVAGAIVWLIRRALRKRRKPTPPPSA